MLEVINLSNQKGAEIAPLRANRSFYNMREKWKACSKRIAITDMKPLCSIFYYRLLSKLQGYLPCEQLLPKIFDFSSHCWLEIYFPLGKSIRELYLPKVWRRSYQGLFSDFIIAPTYCLHPNNSLEIVDLSDNYFG